MIRALHDKLQSGEITAVGLVEQYADVCRERDVEIRAFLSTSFDAALAQAKEIDARIAAGERMPLLAGIPCGIKDNVSIKGEPMTAGSKILEGYTAPYDATVITKLRTEGAVFLGKTNLDEFACGSSTENSAFVPTKNPLDTTRVPGGSSGGSAAAVAAGEVVWALGTDTGGSVRQPASFCGLVGLKPTYGRVSRYGLTAMGSSLDQAGPITQTVEDAAIVLSALAGRDVHDATTARSDLDKPYEDYLQGDIAGAKIGIPRKYISDDLDAGIRAQFDAAVAALEKAGAQINDIELPHVEYALATYYTIMPAEVSSNLARFDGVRYGARQNASDSTILEQYKKTRAAGFGDEIKRRIMLGTYVLSAGHYDAYYAKAQKVRTLIRQDFRAAFEQVDYIFTPTTPEVAFKAGEKTADPLTMYLSDIYTITANLAGVPAISVPIGTIEDDGSALPVGGQFMGAWFDEEGILNAAHTLEQLLAN